MSLISTQSKGNSVDNCLAKLKHVDLRFGQFYYWATLLSSISVYLVFECLGNEEKLLDILFQVFETF